MGFDKDFHPILRFMAVSDIHVKDNPENAEIKRFQKAITEAYALCDASPTYQKLDALYIIGDFANTGSECQMRQVKEVIDTCVKPETLTRLTMASHCYHTEGGEEAARERFAKIFPDYPLDSHEVINDFHFIALTTTRGVNFDKPQREFAKEELKKAAATDSEKPIFFFQHPHLSNTVYGSIAWGKEALIPILMNYPQVIDFSGHSHAPINDPRSVHQQYFTSVGTGSLSYFELDEFDKIYGTVPPNSTNCAQMLLVEADAQNRVRIYPYDVLTGQFFPQIWKIDKPGDPASFLYTDARYQTPFTPAFSEDAVLCISPEEGAVTVSFPQAKPAKGEDYVNSYFFILRKEGKLVKQFSIWSEYYFINQPERMTWKIDELERQTAYTLDVYPEGFFRNRGKKPLSAAFITK